MVTPKSPFAITSALSRLVVTAALPANGWNVERQKQGYVVPVEILEK
jgi:hypothetical protein